MNRQMRTRRNTHRLMSARGATPGQAIVLLALLMVLLMAFIGLAVDGGQLFFLQRSAQNAIDAALVAAINEKCTSYDYALSAYNDSNVEAEARKAATANGFTDGVDGASVEVNIPPTSGTAAGDPDYVEVVITDDTPTYFIHLVYAGPSQVTVRGVSQCKPAQLPFEMQAIVALNKTASCAVDISGTGTAITGGAGVFSNSSACDDPDDPGPQSSACFHGNGTADIDNPGVTTVGCIYEQKSSNLDTSNTTTGATQENNPFWSLPSPNFACTGTKQAAPKTQGSQTLTVSPGYYAGLDIIGGTMTLQPGVYCLEANGPTNKAINANGGNLIGHGVILYIKEGSVDLTGNGDYDLHAPSRNQSDPYYCGTLGLCNWAGLLFWSDASSGSSLVFNGNGSSTFTGSVIAPQSHCQINGTGDNYSIHSQFICDTFQTNGDGAIEIIYNPPDLYYIPPSLFINE